MDPDQQHSFKCFIFIFLWVNIWVQEIFEDNKKYCSLTRIRTCPLAAWQRPDPNEF